MARPDQILAPEEVAQMRKATQMIFLFAEQIHRRDKQLAELLKRARDGAPLPQLDDVGPDDPDVYAAKALDAIEGKLETLASTVAGLADAMHRLSSAVEARQSLVSEALVSQTYEALRGVRDDAQKAPQLAAGAIAPVLSAQLGELLAELRTLLAAAERPIVVEVIPAPRRRRTREAA